MYGSAKIESNRKMDIKDLNYSDKYIDIPMKKTEVPPACYKTGKALLWLALG